MERQYEEKEPHQVCAECGKRLIPRKEPNMSYVILNKEQFLMNINESSLYPDPLGSITELRHGGDKEQSLYHAIQTGELLAPNACLDCLNRIMTELDTSIDIAEEIRKDYADNLRSMEEETRARMIFAVVLLQI